MGSRGGSIDRGVTRRFLSPTAVTLSDTTAIKPARTVIHATFIDDDNSTLLQDLKTLEQQQPKLSSRLLEILKR
jgi:hypothetical protein